VLTGALIRSGVWSPATVDALQRELMAIARDANAANPPPVVTHEPLSAAGATEKLAGLGTPGQSNAHGSERLGTEDGRPGRHNWAEDPK
jgi:hypothetical protein